MPLKLKVKKDDLVTVITGDDKGKSGKIISVFKKSNSVLVQGLNLVKKTVKNQEGKNFNFIEKPINISNIKLQKTQNDIDKKSEKKVKKVVNQKTSKIK